MLLEICGRTMTVHCIHRKYEKQTFARHCFGEEADYTSDYKYVVSIYLYNPPVSEYLRAVYKYRALERWCYYMLAHNGWHYKSLIRRTLQCR